jgi:hypothetical protein
MEDSLPINLLLFPLVGGYYITTRLEASKYIGQRLTSQALIFNAVLVAMPLLVASLIITTTLTAIFKTQVEWTKQNVFPIKDDYFGTCLLSLALAYGFTRFRNSRIDDTDAIYSAIQVIGNELELLFATSCVDSQLIQITLKNDKVYVGWVKVLPKPSQCPYVQLIPLFSGYRNAAKELQITTDYSPIYSQLIKRGKITNLEDADVNLVVQVNEVISASKFDFDVFEAFVQAKKNSNQPQP